ncbi:MAG: DUF1292 domain-containing protein [Christensenellaceae bacterium]|nr:DUF1292 domain-containing protein [Christensenellaceae bacterium]
MPDLNDAVVTLTAPDGTELLFRYGATILYAEQPYVVLLEMENTPDGEEQILVTRFHEDGESMSFEVVEEGDIIEHVFDKYVQMTTQDALGNLQDAE